MELPVTKRANTSREAASSSSSSLRLDSASPAVVDFPAAAAAAVPSAPSLDGATASTALVDDNADRLASLSLSPRPDKEAVAAGNSPPEALPEQYDAVIFHDPADTGRALLFRDRLVELVGQGVLKVTVFGCEATTAGRLQYEALEDSIRRSTFMLLFITSKFCDGPVNIMLRDTCLSEMLANEDKRWCLIPVWTAPEEEYSRPMALRPLTGISEKNMSDTFRRSSIVKVFSEKRPQREKREKEQQERLAREAHDRQRREEEVESQRKHREYLQRMKEDHQRQLQSKQFEAELEQRRAEHVLALLEEEHAADVKQTLAQLAQREQELRHDRDQRGCSQWLVEQRARQLLQAELPLASAGGGVPSVLHLRGGYATGAFSGSSSGGSSAAAAPTYGTLAANAPPSSSDSALKMLPLYSAESGLDPRLASAAPASAAGGQLWQQPVTYSPHDGAAAVAATQPTPFGQQLLQQPAQMRPSAPFAVQEPPSVQPPPYSSSLFHHAQRSGTHQLLPHPHVTPWSATLPEVMQPAAPTAADVAYWPYPGAGTAVASPFVGHAASSAAAAGLHRSSSDGSWQPHAVAAAAQLPWPRPVVHRQHQPTDTRSAIGRVPVPGQPSYPNQAAVSPAVVTAYRLTASGGRAAVQPGKAMQQQQQPGDPPSKETTAAPPHRRSIAEESSPPAGGKAKGLWSPADDPAAVRKTENVRDTQQALLNDCAATPIRSAAMSTTVRAPMGSAIAHERSHVTTTPPPKHGGGGNLPRRSAAGDSRQTAAAASTAVPGPASSVSLDSRGVHSTLPTIVGGMQPLDSSASGGSGYSRARLQAAASSSQQQQPLQGSMPGSARELPSAALAGPAHYDPLMVARMELQLQLQQQLLAHYGLVAWPAAPLHFQQQQLRLLAPGAPLPVGAQQLPQSHSVPGSLHELLRAAQLVPLNHQQLGAPYAGGAFAAGDWAPQSSAASPAGVYPASGAYGSIGLADYPGHALTAAPATAPIYPPSDLHFGGGGGYGAAPWDSASAVAGAAAAPSAHGSLSYAHGVPTGFGLPTGGPLLRSAAPPPYSSAVGAEGRSDEVMPTSQQCTDASDSGAAAAAAPPGGGDQDSQWPPRGSSGVQPPGMRPAAVRSGWIVLNPDGAAAGSDATAAVSATGSAGDNPSSWTASSHSSDQSTDWNLASDVSGTGSSGRAATDSDGALHSLPGNGSSGDSGHGGAFHELPHYRSGVSNGDIPAPVLLLLDSLAAEQAMRGPLPPSSNSLDSSRYSATDSSHHVEVDGDDTNFNSMQPLTTNPPH